MDIDGWLRGIGLSRYAENFRANEIDSERLSRRTNADLKDIGVASLGHRKKFLKAIAAAGDYLFKRALVQDAAYGTLLCEPRPALHARIAEVLESQFADIAESEPELLARHCTEAGLVEKASREWGKGKGATAVIGAL